MDRCFADAVAAVPGCRLSKRTLKYLDYGEAACTFYDDRTGWAVRILSRDDARDRVALYAPFGMAKYETQTYACRVMPDEEWFVVQDVWGEIPAEDRPGRPVSRVFCAECGEGVNDGGRCTLVAGRCAGRAPGGYYALDPLTQLPLTALHHYLEPVLQS